MITAVLCDLDDTLYPQSAWLAGAWNAVATRAAEAYDVSRYELLAVLNGVAAEGSDRGRIIDRALAAVGRRDVPIVPLLDAFRRHAPAELTMYSGVREALAELRSCVRIAVVTDGEPAIQRAKVQALGLEVDAVVYSDELGRDRRKPHPLPFDPALAAVGARATDAVFVGDRPGKDIAGAAGVGMRTVRVLTGEHAPAPDDPPAWRVAANAADAFRMLHDQAVSEALVR